MGIGAIPYSEISSWLDENLIYHLDERNRYRKLITAIDDKFISLQNSDKKVGNDGQ